MGNKISAEHIRINAGGYDSRGRYWGTGTKLYRVTDEDGHLDVHVRAPDAKTAKERAAKRRKGSWIVLKD